MELIRMTMPPGWTETKQLTDPIMSEWMERIWECHTCQLYDQIATDLLLLLSDPDSAPRVTRLLTAIEEMLNE